MLLRKGLALCIAIAAVLFLGSVVPPVEAGQVTLHVVDVDAHEGIQVWVPSSITAKKGDTITLILTNHLMEEHGYEIEAFGVKEVIGNHQTKTVSFKAAKAGIFPIKCQLHKAENHYAGQLVVIE
ncbi:Nitrous-oxide reductase [Candidatus Methylomirabilis lanthanidiphila]|uniref:Nitrous-oxide reductase n=1 Tax=Candidatus Methylomirabilis lanthanidiphila TaxID=2211376 RepID=A0A564ZJ00_9BACT|nr:cupredoxin domain-containing protein [Candidatus Methylomirabilis lanthanidiphila]VUZ84622.1 Nitrous-oxide reductase [Candidatus Methylomirabilis lanthanidiphila]